MHQEESRRIEKRVPILHNMARNCYSIITSGVAAPADLRNVYNVIIPRLKKNDTTTNTCHGFLTGFCTQDFFYVKFVRNVRKFQCHLQENRSFHYLLPSKKTYFDIFTYYTYCTDRGLNTIFPLIPK